ncbi:MAG: 50S ribosomal protein L10 [Deltaproteobacteria bacterium]|nr:50S ribosomal protein L10 [Deltaproteobacteria bacterium]
MERSEKAQVVAALHEKLARAQTAVLTDFRGLNVGELSQLRRELRQGAVDYQVVKNTLLRLAARDTAAAPLLHGLTGPTGVAIGYTDPVAPARVLTRFARTQPKLAIKGGILQGRRVEVEEIRALAELPSRGVLLGRLLGLLQAVPASFVRVLAAVPQQFVGTLEAIKQQKGA